MMITEEGSFTFAQLCDPQLGMGGYEDDKARFAQAVSQINELKPNFALVCGDLVDRPDDQSYGDIMELMKGLDIPCYWVPGNHDLLFEPYDHELGISQKESLRRYREALGDDYFSFSHQRVRFVCVNTQLWFSPVADESEKQDRWLRSVFKDARENEENIYVVGHHPLFLVDPDEEDGYYNIPTAKRTELLKLFSTHEVRAFLSGHTHRPILNAHGSMELVAGEPTSVAFRGQLGFRLWEVSGMGQSVNNLVPLGHKKENSRREARKGVGSVERRER